MSGDFYFTSDQHFGHKMVAGLRGYDEAKVHEHDEMLIEAWSARVKPGDVVFCLGDFMLPYHEEYATKLLRQLNGTKQLIIGNHDTGQLAKHKLWAWTGHIRGRKIADTPFVLCHYAMRSWPGMGKGSIHLYGHSHGNLAPDYGRSMDVGVDTRPDFAPWHIDEVRELLLPLPVLIVDHHDANEDDELTA